MSSRIGHSNNETNPPLRQEESPQRATDAPRDNPAPAAKVREPVVLPIRDVNILRDASDATTTPTLLRVFRDHEPGVPPMYFVDFVSLFDGKARRGLIPIVDIDAPKLAQAIMRVQEEHAQMTAKWREDPVKAQVPEGKFIPPRAEVQEGRARFLPPFILVD